MNNENYCELNNDDMPSYLRLILGIIFSLFAIISFSIYYFIIKQLAGLVSSWIGTYFHSYLSGGFLFYIDQFRSLA
jgi:hypothetical protein